jgi:hypothetical protein
MIIPLIFFEFGKPGQFYGSMWSTIVMLSAISGTRWNTSAQPIPSSACLEKERKALTSSICEFHIFGSAPNVERHQKSLTRRHKSTRSTKSTAFATSEMIYNSLKSSSVVEMNMGLRQKQPYIGGAACLFENPEYPNSQFKPSPTLPQNWISRHGLS